jgi:hypothetical protein
MDDRVPGADELLAAFARWASDQRASDAAASRSRRRWLRQQESEATTLAGVLLDMAEWRTPVALSTTAHRWTGRLVGLGRDFCVVEDRGGRSTIVSAPSLVSVRPGPGTGELSGDRRPPVSLDMVGALELLAAQRCPVRLALAGGDVVAGDLAALGVDVAVVLLSERGRRHAYLPVAAIEACSPS